VSPEVERLHARFREQAKHLEQAAAVCEAKAKALQHEADVLRAVSFYVSLEEYEVLRKQHAVMAGGRPWDNFAWSEDGIGSHPVHILPKEIKP